MKKLIVVILFAAAPAFAGGGPDGRALFKTNCSACHGPDGAGQTPVGKSLKVRDLRSADVQKRSDEELGKVIADGKGNMPAFKDRLGPADIGALVAFIRSIRK